MMLKQQPQSRRNSKKFSFLTTKDYYCFVVVGAAVVCMCVKATSIPAPRGPLIVHRITRQDVPRILLCTMWRCDDDDDDDDDDVDTKLESNTVRP